MLKMVDLYELSEDTSQKVPSLQKKDIDMMVRTSKECHLKWPGMLVGKVELSI